MSLVYSSSVINARLQAVLSAIDSGSSNGILTLLAGGTTVSTQTLLKPSGSVAGGILTFFVPVSGFAVATGSVTTGTITNSAGSVVASNLSAGVTGSGSDITIFNGLNSTLISSGQSVVILAAQINGA